jgi:hypothetical protein
MSKFSDSIRVTAMVTAIVTITFVACAGDDLPNPTSRPVATGGSAAGVSNGSAVGDNGWGGSSTRAAAGAGGSSTKVAGATGGSSSAAGGTKVAPATRGAAGAPPLDPNAPCLQTATCGPNSCTTQNITGGISTAGANICACCAANNACGMYAVSANEDTKCIELDEKGQETTDCPTMFEEAGFGNINPQDVPGFSSPDYTLTADIRGCCRPDGRCGWVMPTLGVGCVALDDLHAISSLFELIVLPPIYCTYDWGKPR